HKADGWSNSTLPGQPWMSGRAFKYLTQPTRRDFNLGGDQNRSHPEGIPHAREKSKDPAKVPVGLATGFLDFARNERRCYAHARSADADAACVPSDLCEICR